MSEEIKQVKKEDITFVSPEGANMKVVCITIQRPEMVVNGNTQPRVYREIKPINGHYTLKANSLYYDEQRDALVHFAKRYGLKRFVAPEKS